MNVAVLISNMSPNLSSLSRTLIWLGVRCISHRLENHISQIFAAIRRSHRQLEGLGNNVGSSQDVGDNYPRIPMKVADAIDARV